MSNEKNEEKGDAVVLTGRASNVIEGTIRGTSGGGFYVTIPRDRARRMGLRDGDPVQIAIKKITQW